MFPPFFNFAANRGTHMIRACWTRVGRMRPCSPSDPHRILRVVTWVRRWWWGPRRTPARDWRPYSRRSPTVGWCSCRGRGAHSRGIGSSWTPWSRTGGLWRGNMWRIIMDENGLGINHTWLIDRICMLGKGAYDHGETALWGEMSEYGMWGAYFLAFWVLWPKRSATSDVLCSNDDYKSI